MATIPDFLAIPHNVPESFHTRVGQPVTKRIEPQAPARAFGFPVPGTQSPSAASVMAKDYFVTDSTWEAILDHGDFDCVVIGSGCTALAFIEEALRLNPKTKILCLERGDFWLPSHFQNLPLPFKMTLGGPSETFPWTLSRETYKSEVKFCHGSAPFFGGRSMFWSAWSPQPPTSLMRDFPPAMKALTQGDVFWRRAKELLNITSAADIDDTVYAGLQRNIDSRLQNISSVVPSADFAQPAQLAVGRRSRTSTLRFNKFSVPGPMLAISERQRRESLKDAASPLQLMVQCTAKRMRPGEDNIVRNIETSRGDLSWSNDKTRVILCSGALPNATLLLNSFDQAQDTVGKRLTGHFLTHVAARIHRSVFGEWKDLRGGDQKGSLELGAHYVAGKHRNGLQYHIQITAIYSPSPDEDAEDAARECPDYAAAATYDQLVGSEEYVVLVCATLGEFSEKKPNSWARLDRKNPDPTSNIRLQFTLTDEDRELWDLMDEATYQTIDAITGKEDAVEYWDESIHGWTTVKPASKQIRIPGVVHDSSTTFVGKPEDGGSVDELFRPHGVKNVHVLGAALHPTCGSWNPTPMICGFAQALARTLHTQDHYQPS